MRSKASIRTLMHRKSRTTNAKEKAHVYSKTTHDTLLSRPNHVLFIGKNQISRYFLCLRVYDFDRL